MERVIRIIRFAQIGMTVHGEKQKLAEHVGRMADAANIALDVKDGAFAVVRNEVTHEDFRAGMRVAKRVVTPRIMRKLSEVQRKRRIERAARMKAGK